MNPVGAAVLALLAERGPAATVCPSEVARRLSAADWRRHRQGCGGRAVPDRPPGMSRAIVRWALAALYLVAAYFHLATPAPFVAITPGFVPYPEQVVFWTGMAEAAGAFALVQPYGHRLRQAGAIGLALYALCVWPANFNHALIDLAGSGSEGGGGSGGGLGPAYHLPRLAFQPVLIWAPLWAADLVRWPFRRV